MGFEPEDKRAWENSEVMRELEKVAPKIYREADESYQPLELGEEVLGEEEVFEEEDDLNELNDSEDIFQKLELFSSINKELFEKIKLISYGLADGNFKKEAFKIERALKDISGRNK